MVIRYHQITLLIHFCWMMTCICLDERTFYNDINSRILLIGFKYNDNNFYSAGHLESLFLLLLMINQDILSFRSRKTLCGGIGTSTGGVGE